MPAIRMLISFVFNLFFENFMHAYRNCKLSLYPLSTLLKSMASCIIIVVVIDIILAII